MTSHKVGFFKDNRNSRAAAELVDATGAIQKGSKTLICRGSSKKSNTNFHNQRFF